MKDSIAYTIVEKESGIPVGSVGCSYYGDEVEKLYNFYEITNG